MGYLVWILLLPSDLGNICAQKTLSFSLKMYMNRSIQGRLRSPHKNMTPLAQNIFFLAHWKLYKQSCISILNVKSGSGIDNGWMLNRGETEDGITWNNYWFYHRVVCPVSIVRAWASLYSRLQIIQLRHTEHVLYLLHHRIYWIFCL